MNGSKVIIINSYRLTYCYCHSRLMKHYFHIFRHILRQKNQGDHSQGNVKFPDIYLAFRSTPNLTMPYLSASDPKLCFHVVHMPNSLYWNCPVYKQFRFLQQ